MATVPIIHLSHEFPQLRHLASLSGILKCICRHFRHASSSLPILQQPICSIPMGTWVPECITWLYHIDKFLQSLLKQMSDESVPELPVLKSTDLLSVNAISRESHSSISSAFDAGKSCSEFAS